MNEYAKTTIYVALAAVALLLAWVARPAVPGRGVVDDTGELFFVDFNDPLVASSLEIIGFNEETGTAQAFKVARHDGVWSIPSHANYPADAENKFADATASMIGLVKGTDVSDLPSDHELYGVVDSTEAGPGASGVGKRVKIQGADGRTLADLIIGGEVKDSPEHRFVRLPGRDRVYLAAVAPEKFSTRFEDWIERDLLQLDPTKITEVIINDYSIDEFSRQIIQGDVLRLSWDNDERVWSLEGLAEGDELQDKPLNDMKRSVEDLEIIDVHRKPAGLGAELRAEDSLRLDSEAVRSLQSRGYYVVQGRLLSNQGETIIRTDDGIQYSLRFGEIALTPGRDDGDEDGDDAEASSGTSRYLFVTAEFNADLIPPPDVLELPELPELPEDSQEAADDPDTEGDDVPSTQPSLADTLEQARARIAQDNKSKQDEYDAKLETGRTLARELNDRFADWYYVISDPVYQKIRLSRDDIVTPAEPAGDPSSS